MFLQSLRRLTASAPIPPEEPILAENQKYTVKLLSSRREYTRLQRLRWDVFHREYQQKIFPFGFDRDKYEAHAKHIIVLDRGQRDKVIGGYRVIMSSTHEHYYSDSEFQIAPFVSKPGTKLELSRACIHRNHRNGAVLALLWRGIAEYFDRTGADLLFGIPSIKTVDPAVAARVYNYYEAQGKVDPTIDVRPRTSHRLDGFDAERRQQTDVSGVAGEIPALFKAYIKAGAIIAGEPAVDADFGCVDFFMVLQREWVAERYRRKYVP